MASPAAADPGAGFAVTVDDLVSASTAFARQHDVAAAAVDGAASALAATGGMAGDDETLAAWRGTPTPLRWQPGIDSYCNGAARNPFGRSLSMRSKRIEGDESDVSAGHTPALQLRAQPWRSAVGGPEQVNPQSYPGPQ